MNAKLAAAIVFILAGCSFSTIAQSTAYANVYAEIVEIAGIENSAEQSFNEFSPSRNSINVVLIPEEEIHDPYIEPLHDGSTSLASFKIQGGTTSTFYIALTRESESETEKQYNPMILNDMSELPASEQKNSDLIKSGSTLIFPVNLHGEDTDTDSPFHVTLNFN
jgi:hypothetical protein